MPRFLGATASQLASSSSRMGVVRAMLWFFGAKASQLPTRTQSRGSTVAWPPVARLSLAIYVTSDCLLLTLRPDI